MPVQKGADELKPADDARCIEENSPVSCSDISSVINGTRGDSMSGADAINDKRIFIFYTFHRFICIFNISLIRPYLMSHDQST